jgi:hypothetical protein
MRATFQSLRVRKLTGKPAFLTIADSESETPRIHCFERDYESGSNSFLAHSDLVSFAARAASFIRLASPGVNRKAINTPFAFCVPILGLPACFFIINVIQLSCNECKSV